MKEFTKILLFVIIFSAYFNNVQAELKLLNMVFRHGDRAPDSNDLESYPNDPHANQTFWPTGLGGFLNIGKSRLYELGQFLRETYGTFLGDTYVSKEVGTRSTDSSRTKMSLQLVLAGLYPPKGEQKWNEDLDWQPIPIHSVATMNDTLMIPEVCPNYLKAREKAEASSEFRKKLASFEGFMKALSIFTGKTISNSNDMYFLYHGLTAQKAIGLEIPDWADSILASGELLDGINLEYEIASFNIEMRKLNGGMLLRKFMENMFERAKNPSSEHKVYFYSGHESNVASTLQALGIYETHVPEYSSAVIFELHEENDMYFVRVKYYKGIVEDGKEMVEAIVVPGCTEKCPLYKFISVLKDVTPSNNDILCNKQDLQNILNGLKVAPNIILQIEQQFAEDDKNSKILH